jgi:thiosulfate/3-mercaptopyruvate sulfurtransferase
MNISAILDISDFTKLQKEKSLIIIDVRSGSEAKKRYEKGHIENAIFVDLDTQLADIKPDTSIGGRHPLPSIDQFSKLLGVLGIQPDSHVIVYDDGFGGNGAARFWWMLRAAGHIQVQVFNGGLQYAEKHGITITPSIPVIKAQTNSYPTTGWLLPLVSIQDVEKASISGSPLIIDVRSAERYMGLFEPIDKIAGHIPNAVNYPYFDHLTDDGTFQSVEEIQKMYDSIFKQHSSDQIIVHCGSGVTACHLLLALDYAGFPIPNLYIGSWSEWSQNGKPIAKTEQ